MITNLTWLLAGEAVPLMWALITSFVGVDGWWSVALYLVGSLNVIKGEL